MISLTGGADNSAHREPPYAVDEAGKAEEKPQQHFNGETSAGEALAFSDAPALGTDLLAHSVIES